MELPNTLRSLADQVDDLEYVRGQYKAIAERFKAERDELKANIQDAVIGDSNWRELVGELDFEVHPHDVSVGDVFEAIEDDAKNRVPRIITADEVEVGMWAAWRHNGRWWAEVVEGDYLYDEIDGPLVLLADAPPQEPEKPGYQEFYDSIGATDPLHRTTPPEPARRGRVVKASELRDGDVYDVINHQGVCVTAGAVAQSLDYESAFSESAELRLISRKPPEPSEHPVILVHRANQEYNEPVPAYQLSVNAWITPDREKVFYAETIKDWEPARVVPAGQEG